MDLNGNDRIRKKGGFFLLLVFALSITPRTFLHEAFAGHRDGIVCQHPGKNLPCFHRQAFHCSFNDLVVTAPYLAPLPLAVAAPPCFDNRPVSFFLPALLPAVLLRAENRGPPVGRPS
ncbi:hypothetical protein [Flavisolibacter nicotianae]|uniref:hypothetical protein n=1 Tax=Flavisolibacter nicotianae TaxID=2364882 RepID=UPI000EB117BA|nr:hypothetical protein [Flavisolibacter nicotianae]